MEDIRQISNRIAMLERQAESLKMNVNMLQTHIKELMVAKETIENIQKSEDGQEVLFPIGGGGFTYGKLTDNKNVIINIGSNVVVKHNIENASALMDTRLSEMKELLNKTSSSYSEVTNAMANLEKQGRDLVQQQQQNKA